MKAQIGALFLLGLTLAGCSPASRMAWRRQDARPATVQPAPVASSGEIPFVTDRPRAASPASTTNVAPATNAAPAAPRPVPPAPVPELLVATTVADPAPVILSPRPEIIFPESETQHVRLSKQDPFGGQSRIELPSWILAQEFCYPYPGKKISPYGMRGRSMHTGVDIKAVPSDTIRAAFPGVVRMSKLYSGYGNVIVVRHYNGLESVYSHNIKNLVTPNDVVEAGTPIALAGRTGRATTEHLHFELRIAGEPFDPELLLDTEHRCLKQGTLVLATADGKASASFRADGTATPADWLAQQAQQTQPVSAPVTAQASQPLTNQIVAPGNADAASVHVVKRGDTLYQIARQNGTTVAALYRLNGLNERSVLHPGDRIKLR